MEALRKIVKGDSPRLLGWGVAICALIIASVSFPSIAENVNTQRAEAYWATKAGALTAAQGSPKDAFAEDYAELVLREDLTTPFSRDAYVLKAGAPIDLDSLRAAKRAMSEHQCLSEAVFYEARSEIKAGQRAVAEVVLNRVKSKHYPNTVCGVVYQGSERRTGCQFSFTCDGSLDEIPAGRPWERSRQISALMLSSSVRPITRNATHYHTFDVDPVWSKTLKMTRSIGTHKFYRPTWRERPRASATLAVAPPSP